MVDQNSIFGGMLTTLGAAKKTNCDALGIPWEPRYMLIGDANGTDPVPSPTQTKLINQRYRAQLNQLRVSQTDDNVLIAELVLPPDVGGWWIRELALEDKDGVFSAVANVAPSYKPLLAQGSGRNQVVRMHIITSGTSNIQLKIDPSVVLATRGYVDDLFTGMLPPNKPAGTFTKCTFNNRGVFQSGANPDTLAGMGIKNAYTKTEVEAMNAALEQRMNNNEFGRLLNIQKITASGTYIPTPGMKKVRIRIVGGGGGSGGASATSATQTSASGGGAAGSYAEALLTAADIGASQSVIIGAGGIAGTASGTNGTGGGTGGATSVGALLSAPGGLGSIFAVAIASTVSALMVGGMPGAQASGGNLINMAGAPGAPGIGVNASTLAGHGGSGPLGSGGFGTGTNGAISPGLGYGSGAGGVAVGASLPARNGASGAGGVAIFEEYA